jgi:sulfur carrier protein ThiS
MRLHLGGHLNFYDAQRRTRLDVSVPKPTSLIQVLRTINVPDAEVGVVSVNGKAVAIENAIVDDDDRVEVYPPVGGGQ